MGEGDSGCGIETLATPNRNRNGRWVLKNSSHLLLMGSPPLRPQDRPGTARRISSWVFVSLSPAKYFSNADVNSDFDPDAISNSVIEE